MDNILTQKRLKELLHYDPETGRFTHLLNRSTNAKGGIAGSINKSDGYNRLYIDGKIYKGSRLAWLYVHGYFPENIVDHINKVRDDDRFINLRQSNPTSEEGTSCLKQS